MIPKRIDRLTLVAGAPIDIVPVPVTFPPPILTEDCPETVQALHIARAPLIPLEVVLVPMAIPPRVDNEDRPIAMPPPVVVTDAPKPTARLSVREAATEAPLPHASERVPPVLGEEGEIVKTALG